MGYFFTFIGGFLCGALVIIIYLIIASGNR
jgi:hypothetical protein